MCWKEEMGLWELQAHAQVLAQLPGHYFETGHDLV